MDLIIKRIINNPIDSNCFVIYQINSIRCIIVDPGSKDCSKLINFISKKKLKPDYIILTHEHFDHIWGVNKLKSKYNLKVISSQLCSDKIINRKKNMSVFYDQIGFETYPCDISIESLKNTLNWNSFKINFIKTPGHTDCGICFVIDGNIFVGDLIIPGFKTVTKLPSGSKTELLNSLKLIIENYKDKDILVYPGHKEEFKLSDIELVNIV